MVVARNSWHARVYKWWYCNKYGSYSYPRTTNLCPYMRAVMFWAPLRLLFWDWVKMFSFRGCEVTTNVVTIPLMWVSVAMLLGYLDYKAKLVFAILGFIVVALIIVVSILVSLIIAAQNYKVGRKITDWFFKPIGDGIVKVVTKAKVPTFLDLIHALLRSAHDGVCPPVDFIDSETHEL